MIYTVFVTVQHGCCLLGKENDGEVLTSGLFYLRQYLCGDSMLYATIRDCSFYLYTYFIVSLFGCHGITEVPFNYILEVI